MQTLTVAPHKAVSDTNGVHAPGATCTVTDTDASWLIQYGFVLVPGSNVASLGIAGGAVDTSGNPIGGGGHL